MVRVEMKEIWKEDEGGVCGNGEVGGSSATPLSSGESVTTLQYSPHRGGDGVQEGEVPELSGGLKDRGREEEGCMGREMV